MSGLRVISGDFGKSEPNQSCVEFLRDVLRRAEAGEITFSLIIATTPGGCVVDGWSSCADVRPYTVLGALSAVSHRFSDENIER